MILPEPRLRRTEGDKFCVRISVASGKSVRMTREIWELNNCDSVMPTIPQPAPSSRALRLLLDKEFSRTGSRATGFWVSGEETDARYEESTTPASLDHD